ncbi:hypothetical protein CAPTEDRAFT_201375 [Capitella teleta]|uniref:G-protein coupled receptors family 3 profile domain-containing protein n=1 Tax=Capitella teleta TaxID=283909 RepID=R7TNN9_CAPTE|nr:hypothetical protein CAPTEDRAFT_201375 [Capitella teleta]|eukprot:ELT93156.1 hypothetical protein CAPTEDRAFT_201375 [Capitella teleta]
MNTKRTAFCETYIVDIATELIALKGHMEADGGGCPSKQGMVTRVLLCSVNMVIMSGLLVVTGITLRYRKEKLMKAGSPGLLMLVLIGAACSYMQVLPAAFPATPSTCILIPWLHHIGFTLIYAPLVAKIWRISTIMHVLKSRSLHGRDSHLYRTVALTLFLITLYLTIWTCADPVPFSFTEDQWSICSLVWWEPILVGVQICFMSWGGVLCYRARKAPDLYNESRSVGLSIWNESIWAIVYLFARFLLHVRPDIDMLFILYFLKTQLTVTITIVLIFVPKFKQLFSDTRTLHGTITDVYGGARRVHRLSLAVDKQGGVRHIYCVPCGPLTYTEHEDDSEGLSEEQNDIKENQYTKGEVDNLIEMVSKLKSEKEHYKKQAKHLHSALKEYKKKDLSLSINDGSTCDQDRITSECPSYLATPSEDYEREGDLSQGSRLFGWTNSRKASTATTYLSTSPDNLSMYTVAEDDNILLQRVLKDGTSIVQHPSLYDLKKKNCGCHGEYPRLLNDVDTNCNQDYDTKLVKSVSVHMGDFGQELPRIELEDLTPEPQNEDILEPEKVQRKPRRSKSCSDKMTFVMYI